MFVLKSKNSDNQFGKFNNVSGCFSPTNFKDASTFNNYNEAASLVTLNNEDFPSQQLAVYEIYEQRTITKNNDELQQINCYLRKVK